MAGEKKSLRERARVWFRSHWKLVAAVSLSILAATVMAALCATPVGAPIVAALATVKLFAFLGTVGPIALPFIMAGLTMAASLISFALFNAATWISNWIDNKANPKKDGGQGYSAIPGSSGALRGLGGSQAGKNRHIAEDNHVDSLDFSSSSSSSKRYAADDAPGLSSQPAVGL